MKSRIEFWVPIVWKELTIIQEGKTKTLEIKFIVEHSDRQDIQNRAQFHEPLPWRDIQAMYQAMANQMNSLPHVDFRNMRLYSTLGYTLRFCLFRVNIFSDKRFSNFHMHIICFSLWKLRSKENHREMGSDSLLPFSLPPLLSHYSQLDLDKWRSGFHLAMDGSGQERRR